MIKKNIIIFLGLFIIIVICYYVLNEKIIKEKSCIINGRKINLEIASNNVQRRNGLSNRNELCPDCGMMFVFPKKGEYSFWMKDMNFPLDIIWILDNKVVHLEKNIKGDFKGILSPGVKANKVLEINAGKSDEIKIDAGSEVIF